MDVVVDVAVIMEDVIGRHLASRAVFSSSSSSNRGMLVNFIVVLFNDTGMKVKERKREMKGGSLYIHIFIEISQNNRAYLLVICHHLYLSRRVKQAEFFQNC